MLFQSEHDSSNLFGVKNRGLLISLLLDIYSLCTQSKICRFYDLSPNSFEFLCNLQINNLSDFMPSKQNTQLC